MKFRTCKVILKTPDLRIGLSLGIFLLLLNFNTAFSQVSYEFTLPDTFNAIDIFIDDNQFLNIVEKNALYQLNGGKLEKKKTFPRSIDRFGFKSTHNGVRIYNNLTIGFTELDKSGNLISHEAPINHSYLSKLGASNYLLLGKHLYEYHENNWTTLSYSNQRTTKFVTNDNNDRLLFGDNRQILSYDPLIGIDTLITFPQNNTPNLLVQFEGNYYYAYGNKLYKSIQNESSISITDSLEFDAHDAIVDLMPFGQQLIAISNNTIYLIDLQSMNASLISFKCHDMEEWLALEPITEESFWLLSTQSLYLINNSIIHSSKIGIKSDESIFHYRINQNDYISEGTKVFKKDKKTNSYTIDLSKRAPSKVVKNGSNHPFLIFRDFAIQIHEETAIILKHIKFPIGETCNDLYIDKENVFIATDQNLYLKTNSSLKKTSQNQERYSKFIISDSTILLKGESWLYKIQDDQVSQFIEINDIQDGLIEKEGKLFYSSVDNSLKYIDLNSNDVYEILRSIAFLDFTIHNNQLFLLSNKSLIIYDLDKLIDGTIQINQIIPLPFNSSATNIIDVTNNMVLLQIGENVFELEIPTNAILKMPSVLVENNSDDQKLTVKHTNHWSSNPRFNYFFSSKTGNEAVWTNNPYYDYQEIGDKFETVMVSMKDDVFPQNSYSNILKLKPTEIKLNYPFYIISLLIIFAASFLGLRLIRT